ncbi:MAG: TIGR01212 family radical SAM protein [Tissierellia bacterium]|nr:TIGR01212 family radical SAM protein [Tissierellia bacterium]
MSEKIYNSYSKFLKDKFGEKVYKLPIKLNLTCPNRDGTCGHGGCIFCGEEGGSFENQEGTIKDQLLQAKKIISKRYKAKKYIAYFQNFTNTYVDFSSFQSMIEQSLIEDVVGLSISTRPDCLYEQHLDYLEKISKQYFVTMELGLQTVNYHTLQKINRGHGLAEFIQGVMACHSRNIAVCVHIIIGLPWDDDLDLIECARILNVLEVEEVKIHALYIVKNTILGDLYEEGKISMISLEEYKRKVILFLRHLNSNIIIERIIGRAPEENSLFCNWDTSWWKIRDDIVKEMKEHNFYQGQLMEKGMINND